MKVSREQKFTQVLDDGAEPAVSAAPSALSGVPLCVAAAFMFSVHGCSIRVASDAGFSTTQLSLVVGLVRLGLAALIMPFRRKWWPSILCSGQGLGFAALVIFRMGVGCLALVCIFEALRRLPIGEGTAIVFTGPIWTTGLARIWLGEPITRYSIAAVCLAVVGVGLISTGQSGANGPADAADSLLPAELDIGVDGADGALAYSERTVGIALALLGALCLSVVIVSTRKIGERMPAVVTIGWYGASLFFASACAAIVQREPLVPEGIDPWLWLLVFSSATLSFGAQTFNTMALQRLAAGPVQVLGTLEICFSFVWQVTFLQTPLSARSAIGALTIISCAALAAAQTLLARPRPGGDESIRTASGLEVASWREDGGAADGRAAQSTLGRLWAPRGRHAPLAVEPAPDTEEAAGVQPMQALLESDGDGSRSKAEVRHSLAAIYKPTTRRGEP